MNGQIPHPGKQLKRAVVILFLFYLHVLDESHTCDWNQPPLQHPRLPARPTTNEAVGRTIPHHGPHANLNRTCQGRSRNGSLYLLTPSDATRRNDDNEIMGSPLSPIPLRNGHQDRGDHTKPSTPTHPQPISDGSGGKSVERSGRPATIPPMLPLDESHVRGKGVQKNLPILKLI